ncbi:MAG TPA: hypothetical protein VKF79_03395 [Candidatus Acidoferrum sp.]|nr:hypothetical protein [Candidatus Acidoferrum sp.]
MEKLSFYSWAMELLESARRSNRLDAVEQMSTELMLELYQADAPADVNDLQMWCVRS